MKTRYIFVILALIPGVAFAASRVGSNVRVGAAHTQQVAAHKLMDASPIRTKQVVAKKTAQAATDVSGGEDNGESKVENSADNSAAASSDCRKEYRDCMDDFCLLDESEGNRCACSSNINSSKKLIQEIQQIQDEADKLYTEGVEREQLGAKAKFIFGESEKAKKSSRVSGINFSDWISSTTDDDESLDEDSDIGDNLYSMASDYCQDTLKACGSRAEMEEALYSRQIVSDCKNFSSYLAEQKTNALANKRTAEAAVREARLQMLDTTNKYNRGECLLAYKSCIANKGGCGANFENCLDADLLGRRANACENVLDQCMYSREDVLKDWEAESQSILIEAAKFADKNARATCLAKIEMCLEDNCSTGTNPACLTNLSVAAGICPIIDECNEKIPGIKGVINDKLAYLRTKFCQNDIDKCLRDKCGEDFNGPQCLGKKTSEITKLCPQDMYPSCKTEEQFDVIVQAVLLRMDYKMMAGCINYFSEQLGRVCGTDMSCLPSSDLVASLTAIPDSVADTRAEIKKESQKAVDDFFEQFEGDAMVKACAESQKPKGQSSLGSSVFTTAKMIAYIGAENRAMRELESKIAELSRKQDIEKAEKNCLGTYKVEKPQEGKKNYSYIKSVSFEPSLRNCHICRVEQVCEKGGESKGSAAMKGVAGGLAAGASAGTMVSPGWGTAIGGAIGAIGGGLMGGLSAHEEEFCQEVESCEDVNM